MEPRISIITLGVRDLVRSYEFYHHGLGFPTTRSPNDGIIFFQTAGTCLALYPHDKLAEDVAPEFPTDRSRFPGVTLAYNARTRDEVDAVLAQALKAGAVIEKTAQVASWGGYSGYFSDPDGYLWEVAWAESWKFHDDGSLVIE
jgi:catechol 2,3-dioxygenase-like lactoylglutathione lyase family enzyme